MFSLALGFIQGHGAPSYATRAEAIAAFESAKLEFYRRHLARYEDLKCAHNTDIVSPR